jgi:hypothetical protein
MVHGRARVHDDEDGVSQIGEDDGESSRRRARMTKKRQDSAGGRTRVDIGGLIGLASKSGSQSRRAAACERV